MTSTPLHRRASDAFQKRVVRGFTTFAPDETGLLDLAGEATGLLVAVNAEKLANAHPMLQRIANASLAYPDGMGAVFALRRLGVRAQRIAGADLWIRLVEQYAGRRRFYLIGASATIINEVADRLRLRYPGIELDYRDGFLQAGDEERLCDQLRTTRPDIVLIGMGSPRQEILMERLYTAHPALYMGLGGSFDAYVGRKPRAPRLVQRLALEWAYQFVREPRRLHRLPAYLKFAALLASGKLD